MRVYDIVVIGKNISAITAGIYAAMSKKSLLCIEHPGEVHTATGVDKYTGNLSGDYNALYTNIRAQFKQFKVPELERKVEGLECTEEGVVIRTDQEEITAKSLIVSTKDVSSMLGESSACPSVFLCGEALNGDKEALSLAGTGCMAAMDARFFLVETEGKRSASKQK
ncbi:hypothetical protein NECID01_1971 [Nematocida sp. AWRm77]|nr:hypothetical protein NECID01_1971 [Nematocida sp. AWRm77]